MIAKVVVIHSPDDSIQLSSLEIIVEGCEPDEVGLVPFPLRDFPEDKYYEAFWDELEKLVVNDEDVRAVYVLMDEEGIVAAWYDETRMGDWAGLDVEVLTSDGFLSTWIEQIEVEEQDS
jgi:hypothetical protein